MRSRALVKGIFLLLVFGAVCGVCVGMFVGGCFGLLFFINFGTTISVQRIVINIGYGLLIGGLTGLVPGLLFGLASYYIVKKWQWPVDAGLYGGIGYIIIIQLFARKFAGEALLICVLCGFLAGMFNLLLPTWWGRKLHAKAVNLLGPNR